MSKELEALKEIVDYAINGFTDNEKKYQKDLEIIETALKEHEQYKATGKELGIDPLIFLKALLGSAKWIRVWYIDEHKGLQEVSINGFKNYETAKYFTAFNIDIGGVTLGLSQYGKTWALTREELGK